MIDLRAAEPEPEPEMRAAEPEPEPEPEMRAADPEPEVPAAEPANDPADLAVVLLTTDYDAETADLQTRVAAAQAELTRLQTALATSVRNSERKRKLTSMLAGWRGDPS